MSLDSVSPTINPNPSDSRSLQTGEFSEAPAIRLLFDGLMTICFDSKKSQCQIGVPRAASNHELTIKVEKTFAGETKTITTLKGFDTEAIAFALPAGEVGIQTFQKGDFSGDFAKDDPRDFRWVVDLEGPEFHNRKLSIKKGAFRQFITLKSGVFYTQSLSYDEIEIKKAATGEVLNSRKVSTVTGVNVDLQPGEMFALHYGGKNQQRLIFEAEADVTYTLTLDNLCPEAKSLLPNLESDFRLYYTLFDDVPPDQQLDLDIPLAEKEKVQKAIEAGMDEATMISAFGSHKVPCENVYLSQTNDLSNE
jgi:hypothetical protein